MSGATAPAHRPDSARGQDDPSACTSARKQLVRLLNLGEGEGFGNLHNEQGGLGKCGQTQSRLHPDFDADLVLARRATECLNSSRSARWASMMVAIRDRGPG